ncbi:MAG TPA: hypothetical protein H9871_08865, partial [Candidatus Nesterenkonia stercoripullorum]|nr:hypothetical protein [Candidatus Nesterenkonia stercoripullorum]
MLQVVAVVGLVMGMVVVVGMRADGYARVLRRTLRVWVAATRQFLTRGAIVSLNVVGHHHQAAIVLD